MKNLEKIPFIEMTRSTITIGESSATTAGYIGDNGAETIIKSINSLVDSITVLQDQNRELWEYVTSKDRPKAAQTEINADEYKWVPAYTIADLREKLDQAQINYTTNKNGIKYFETEEFLDWLESEAHTKSN
jgi:hypothetical protein